MNKGQRQKRSEKYLLPLLTNGPNNQIRGLKWALVMAKMLDRFVLMCAVIMITNALSSFVITGSLPLAQDVASDGDI